MVSETPSQFEMKYSEQFFRDVVDALEATGLNYWLAWGTCLAAVREGTLIPWDIKEMDFGCCDRPRKLERSRILRTLEGHGLQGLWYRPGRPTLWSSLAIWGSPDMRQVTLNLELPDGGLIERGFIGVSGRRAHVDFYRVNSGYIMEALQVSPSLDGPRFPLSLFAQPKIVDFLGKKVPAPNPPEEYLRLCYGKGWRTPKREGWENDWRE